MGFAVIILLILANGLLAMSEIAIVSARPARLQQRADKGDLGAKAALNLANNSTRFLSTVQIGISGVGVLAGAFGGATIADQLAAILRNVDVLAPYANAIAVGTVVILITYLSLVLGELVPKRIALNDPEAVSSFVSRPMNRLSRLAGPAVHFLTLSTEFVVRLIGLRPPGESPVTDQEIEILLDEGTRAGVFDPAEQDLVKRVFRLGDQRVGALVTPRTEIVALDVEDGSEEIRRKIREQKHSSFPVIQGNIDNVIGMVKAEDLLERLLAGGRIDLTADSQAPLFLSENMPALDSLEHFRRNHTRSAVVIDEYGGTQGLVTLADIVEAIIGEVAAPGQIDEPDMVQREDGSWLVDGRSSIQGFVEHFHLNDWEGKGSFNTVGGFVVTSLGRIPRVGERFERFGLRVEVVDMDGPRVDRVLVVSQSGTAEHA